MAASVLRSVGNPCRRHISGGRREPLLLVAAATMAMMMATAINLKAAPKDEATAPATSAAVPSTRPTADGEPIRVAGRVVDAQGQGVADVLVETDVSGRQRVSVRTDREGKFTLRAAKMIEGWLRARTQDGDRQTLQFLPDIVVNGRLPDTQMTLKPARRLSVTVKDGKGAVVAGAWTVARTPFVITEEVTTDAAGKAALRVPTDAPLTEIVAMKRGVGLDYARLQAREVPPPDTQSTGTDNMDRIELVLNGAITMRIRAIDEHEQPLAGVQVTATMYQKPGKNAPLALGTLDEFRRTTDQHGIAVFPTIPADSSRPVSFSTSRPGYYAPQRCSIDPTSDSKEAEAILLRQVSLTGRVTDSDGRPVESADVLIDGSGLGFSSFHQQQIRTAADGRFTFEVNPATAYLIAATKDRFASRGVLQVVHKQAPTDPVELVLGPATRLYGQVMTGNKPLATPGQYVSIRLNDESYSRLPQDQRLSGDTGNPPIRLSISRWAEVDSTGRFELFIGPGHYGVFAPNARVGKPITISNQKEVEFNPELPATQPAQVLKGRVVLHNKPEVAVPNASITGLEPDARRSMDEIRATSDRQGRFTLGHGNGDIYIHATAEEGKLQGIVLVNDEQEDVIVPVGPTASARGRLVDDQGQPVTRRLVMYGVMVRLHNPPAGRSLGSSTSWLGGQVKTDEKGEFRIEGLVVGAEYTLLVMVDAPNGRGRLVPAIGKVQPESTEQVELGDLKLPSP